MEKENQRVLIASFEGWSDAGTAASSAVGHLAEALEVQPIEEIPADGFVDFQVHRPRIRFDEDGSRTIDWPNSRFWGPVHSPGQPISPDSHDAAASGLRGDDISSAPHEPNAPRRVVSLSGQPIDEIFVFTGVEPARYWAEYIEQLIHLIVEWEIDVVILVGSLFSDTPHSRPVPVQVYSQQESTRAKYDAERSDYSGPIGIGTLLDESLNAVGIDSLMMWAQVPHYVHSMPSPKATLAILDKLEEIANVVIPHGNLIEEAQQWEDQVSMLTQNDEEMSGYIERLEEERDTVESPEATGDALAYEFERFLRRPDVPPQRPQNTSEQAESDESDTASSDADGSEPRADGGKDDDGENTDDNDDDDQNNSV
jgi:hypothetical protein